MKICGYFVTGSFHFNLQVLFTQHFVTTEFFSFIIVLISLHIYLYFNNYFSSLIKKHLVSVRLKFLTYLLIFVVKIQRHNFFIIFVAEKILITFFSTRELIINYYVISIYIATSIAFLKEWTFHFAISNHQILGTLGPPYIHARKKYFFNWFRSVQECSISHY